MGKNYHSPDGFLTLRVQNVCIEAILISLIYDVNVDFLFIVTPIV